MQRCLQNRVCRCQQNFLLCLGKVKDSIISTDTQEDQKQNSSKHGLEALLQALFILNWSSRGKVPDSEESLRPFNHRLAKHYWLLLNCKAVEFPVYYRYQVLVGTISRIQTAVELLTQSYSVLVAMLTRFTNSLTFLM